jgi:hypothetical protein
MHVSVVQNPFRRSVKQHKMPSYHKSLCAVLQHTVDHDEEASNTATAAQTLLAVMEQQLDFCAELKQLAAQLAKLPHTSAQAQVSGHGMDDVGV